MTETTVTDEAAAEPGGVVDVIPAGHHPEEVTLPGVPGHDEFLALAMQARILSMSGAAPKQVRGNPYVAFHVAMVGRDLGISPSAALELIDIIEGGGQIRLSLSPQLINGQIRRLGLGSIVPAFRNDRCCVAVAVGPGGRVDQRCGQTWPDHVSGCECANLIGHAEFSWDDARTAGLVTVGCEPGKHTAKCLNRDSKSWDRCNQGYRTYPKRMMWWRAAGFAADDFFPEAGLGLYSPEALGAVVDENGRPIDPGTVDVPAGYEPPPTAAEKRAAGETAEDRQAHAETLWALQERIAALPEQQRREFADRWKAHERLSEYRIVNLPSGLARLATSMLAATERDAERAGCDIAGALGVVRQHEALVIGAILGAETPQEAPAPPTPQPAPDRAGDEAPAAQEPITAAQLKRVNIILGEHGYTGADRFPFLTTWAEREITSTKDLTKAEAGRFIQEAAVAP